MKYTVSKTAYGFFYSGYYYFSTEDFCCLKKLPAVR